MDVPALARERLGDEPVVGGIDLDGDAVVITPSRTIVYHAEGLLSDESVAEFPHESERIEIREGRRKTTVRLQYMEGDRDFSIPAGHIDELLAPLLWGILYATGVIDEDETVREAYRFSELTLVVTDARVVKHVGNALWDEEYEQFPYADLTTLAVEEGSVATAIVLGVADRRERVKLPNDRAKLVQRTVEQAVLDYHDVDTVEEFRAAVGADDDPGDEAEAGFVGFDTADFEPLVGRTGEGTSSGEPDTTAASADQDTATSADRSGDAGDDVDGESAGAEDHASDPEPDDVDQVSPGAEGDRDESIPEQLTALTDAVNRQNELLEQQRETLDQLVEELRRDR